MTRQFKGFERKNFVLSGQNTDTFDLPEGRVYVEMDMLISADVTTTTGTTDAAEAGLLKLVESLEVVDSDAKTYLKATGEMLFSAYKDERGVDYTNDGLLEATAGSGKRQLYIKVPFELMNGAEARDTNLNTVTKDLNLNINWNDPETAGVLYGDVTGLAVTNASVQIGFGEYGGYANTQNPDGTVSEDPDFTTDKQRPARNRVGFVHTVEATNDEAKILLPIDNQYREVLLQAQEKINGIWKPSDNVISLTKEMAVRSTGDQQKHRGLLGLKWLNETYRERGLANLPDGLFIINMIRHGRLSQMRTSLKGSQLYISVPQVKTANECRILVLPDTIINQ